MHSEVYLIYTNQLMHLYMYYLRNLKFTLKHLKRSYMFRSYDHPQGALIVSCYINFGDVAACCHITEVNIRKYIIGFLIYNFRKEQYMLPEHDCKIETCRSVLSVLM